MVGLDRFMHKNQNIGFRSFEEFKGALGHNMNDILKANLCVLRGVSHEIFQ